MKLLLHWIIVSLMVFATASVIDGISISPFWVTFIVGACLVFINMLIKPIITIVTLPLTIVTLGLFSLVINGLIFWFLAEFITGFTVSTFTAAFFRSIDCVDSQLDFVENFTNRLNRTIICINYLSGNMLLQHMKYFGYILLFIGLIIEEKFQLLLQVSLHISDGFLFRLLMLSQLPVV